MGRIQAQSTLENRPICVVARPALASNRMEIHWGRALHSRRRENRICLVVQYRKLVNYSWYNQSKCVCVLRLSARSGNPFVKRQKYKNSGSLGHSGPERFAKKNSTVRY